MQAMLRKTLTILSLVGLVVSALLWGLTTLFSVGYCDDEDQWAVGATRGCVWLHTSISSPSPWWWDEHTPFDWHYVAYGFHWRVVLHKDNGGILIRIPLWIPAIVCTWVLILCNPSVLRRKRKKHGLCLQCGYDLTGNTTGKCPECGQEI